MTCRNCDAPLDEAADYQRRMCGECLWDEMDACDACDHGDSHHDADDRCDLCAGGGPCE